MTPASIGLALLTPLKRRAMSLNEGPIISDLASWQVKHCFALARAAGSAPIAGLTSAPAQSINTIIVLFMWFTPFTGNERHGVARIARITDAPVARATAARTWRSMSLLAPVACCVVMQRTLGAATERVVSEPSPFGRGLLRFAGYPRRTGAMPRGVV